MNRGYLKKYVPFNEGFLAETDLSLQSKEGLDYYRFRMSNPGLRGVRISCSRLAKSGSTMPKLSMTSSKTFTAR